MTATPPVGTAPRVRGALAAAAARLAAAGVEDAALEAEILLGAVLGRSPLQLRVSGGDPLATGEADAFGETVRRRASREPLQYILGKAAFRELTLAVDRRVLVPRPETEVLVEAVLRWARGRAGLRALDLGTGSGAIALSLLVEGPFERVVATDVSRGALEVAAANAHRLGLAAELDLREGAGWLPLAPGERFDVIVSNPPYVAEAERDDLPPEVREWEPEGALFAGPAGLDVLREVGLGAAGRLRGGGLLALEMAPWQTAGVASWLREDPLFREVRIQPDLAGRARIALAERA